MNISKFTSLFSRFFPFANVIAGKSAVPDILQGKVCPYCGQPTELADSAEIYGGVSYGNIYICRPCKAYVGCHKHTTKALGRLANEELRAAKMRAHGSFDRIWKDGHMSRPKAYSWLASQLDRPVDLTHIGMFDVADCNKVAEIADQYLEALDPARYGHVSSSGEGR